MMDSTYISFYLYANRIHVFVDTLRGIGSPGRICFLLNRDGTRLLVAPHGKKDFVSHSVPENVYAGSDSMEVSSKKLCRLIAGLHNWDVAYSYRVPGFIETKKHVAVFDLSRAEIISRDDYRNEHTADDD